MSEKRKDSREREENKVVIEFVTTFGDSVKTTEVYALTKDISVGGARIVTDWFFPIGTYFKVNLALSKSKQVVHVDGRVRWVMNLDGDEDLFEVGVEFMHEIPETILTLINHIVELEQGVPSVMRVSEPNF